MSVFCDWRGLVAHARANWTVADDGMSIDRTWHRGERNQHVAVACNQESGITWATWSSSIGDDSDAKDARILDLASRELGRIVRREGNLRLEQSIPVATLTPALFDLISEAFASRADGLEQRISGRDDS